ncbi:hypothetical protein [Virgisporangium ochraceum]|uniref:Integral membrane protein n=1 Tax=Virgisporangium ochraceum TaxID=65505 RepID=A0A8J3ZWN8_9ACTN|nr:hypothetical protein [Virgisporangium ochraceum]GIJ68781.1 hypothetical protein Voc01_036980 [Virgisporangium ochraceum]
MRARLATGGGIGALARMRVEGYVRSGRVLAAAMAALIVLGVAYGGGAAQAGEAYGYSAAVLFPVLAAQAQMLLNTEPDVQRRLSMVAVGGLRREILAGALAAVVASLAVVAVAIVAPWPIGGITGPRSADDPGLLVGFTAGIWANLLLVLPAVALGALASRAAVGSTGLGLAVLASGCVMGYVVGVRDSMVWWLGPPLLPTARATVDGLDVPAMLGYTAQSLLWTAAAAAVYVWLRRRH